jgi:D-3-phosphoglycerate dehydrogenase
MDMFNIKLLNKISKKGLEILNKDSFTLSETMDTPDAILLRSFSMHDMELIPSLKAVARAGAGVNNIPIDKCTEKGIVVFNTPGANANAVKELTIAALLMSSRKLIDGVLWTRSLINEGENLSKMVEKGKSAFAGPEIKGKHLGVIGLGAIGVMVANAAKSLGMEVEGYDPYISIDSAWGLSRSVKKAVNLDALLAKSDYITLHVPFTESTRNMIDASKLSQMKKGVRLLNFSRGELVNTKDLIEAIQEDRIAVYATDFPNQELISIKNVIPFPHIGASTPESEENCAKMAASQLGDFLKNGNIRNSVNFPSCQLLKTTDYRITVAHYNIPNMVRQVLSILADEGINVDSMINKSREKVAYTIVDTDTPVPVHAIKRLETIESILRVRVID